MNELSSESENAAPVAMAPKSVRSRNRRGNYYSLQGSKLASAFTLKKSKPLKGKTGKPMARSELERLRRCLPDRDEQSRLVAEIEGYGFKVCRVWDSNRTTRKTRLFSINQTQWRLMKERYPERSQNHDDITISSLLADKVRHADQKWQRTDPL